MRYCEIGERKRNVETTIQMRMRMRKEVVERCEICPASNVNDEFCWEDDGWIDKLGDDFGPVNVGGTGPQTSPSTT